MQTTAAWSKQPKKFDFTYGIWPIYCFSRTVGLWPFSIISSSNGMIQRTQIRAYDAVWFLFSICLFIGAIFISIQQMYLYLRQAQYATLILIGFYTFEIIYLTFGMITIIFDLFNRNKLTGILQKFSNFDNQVSSL